MVGIRAGAGSIKMRYIRRLENIYILLIIETLSTVYLLYSRGHSLNYFRPPELARKAD